MAEYFAIAPVALTLTVVVSKKTLGGKLAVSDVTVTSINGKPSDNNGAYYGFSGKWGDVVLNYKEGGRPAKPEPKADKPLTAADKAQIPGPATKPVKGKGKVAAPAAPAAPAALAPDMAAIVAAVVAALGQK